MTETLLLLAQLTLLAAVVLTLVRLLRGPTIYDRVLCAETLILSLVGWLLIRSAAESARHYVDAAFGLALFSFVGTVFLAHYLERGDIDD